MIRIGPWIERCLWGVVAAAAPAVLFWPIGASGTGSPSASLPASDRARLWDPSVPLAEATSAGIAWPDVRLTAVRHVAGRPERSGAILSVGAEPIQRAVGVGVEIAPGVVLNGILADRIVIASQGVEKFIDFAQPGSNPGPAAPIPGARPEAPDTSDSPTETATPQRRRIGRPRHAADPGVGEAARPGLLPTLAEPVMTAHGAGWPVQLSPELAARAGILPGDIILSINGETPDTGANLVQAARETRLELMIYRSGESRMVRISKP